MNGPSTPAGLVEASFATPSPAGAVAPEVGWLDSGHGPFLGFLHRGRPDAPVGVLIVPPFGWDNMASYGPRRRWAELLAATGVPVARCDLPATADAGGGPEGHGLVDAWTDALSTTAEWLRDETGCRAVVALAISVGGLLALRAATQGAPIDHFALWACQAKGADFEREIRAFSRLEQARLAPDERDSAHGVVPQGAIVAGGYLLTAETRAGLGAVDVATLQLPAASGRHALLMGRGRKPDGGLHERLKAQGVTVTTSDGEGYDDLMIEPQFAKLAMTAVADLSTFIATLSDVPAPPRAVRTRAAAPTQATIEQPDAPPVLETFVRIGHANRHDLVGVLSEPVQLAAGEVGAVLIGGTGHRMGPNRMYTEMARRWSARGVATMRVDIVGAGDAGTAAAPDVATLYTDEDCVQQTLAVIDAFQVRTGCRKVLVLGLCASAYWAVHAALQRDDIVPVALNLPFLLFDPGETSRHAGRVYRDKLRQSRTLKRIISGDIDFRQAIRHIPDVLNLSRHAGAGPLVGPASPEALLTRLSERELNSWFIFAGTEPLGKDMSPGGVYDLAARPHLRLDAFGPNSDLHTLRPLWVQRTLHACVDRALDAELDTERPPVLTVAG